MERERFVHCSPAEQGPVVRPRFPHLYQPLPVAAVLATTGLAPPHS